MLTYQMETFKPQVDQDCTVCIEVMYAVNVDRGHSKELLGLVEDCQAFTMPETIPNSLLKLESVLNKHGVAYSASLKRDSYSASADTYASMRNESLGRGSGTSGMPSGTSSYKKAFTDYIKGVCEFAKKHGFRGC